MAQKFPPNLFPLNMLRKLQVLFWLLMTQVVLAQKYDMRAVWMATVANIDWPSQPNLSESEQKAELISLLDEYEKDNYIYWRL